MKPGQFGSSFNLYNYAAIDDKIEIAQTHLSALVQKLHRSLSFKEHFP